MSVPELLLALAALGALGFVALIVVVVLLDLVLDAAGAALAAPSPRAETRATQRPEAEPGPAADRR